MPLYFPIRNEFYNGVLRFLCNSTLIFTTVMQKSRDSRKSRHTTKSHDDREYVITLQR